MSGQVLDLVAARRERKPHVAGKARCMLCGHEWVQVAPSGMVWLVCPHCDAQKGYFIYPCSLPSGESIWNCTCGNHLFELTPDGALCPNCGTWQNWGSE